jgi:hypothetical protein
MKMKNIAEVKLFFIGCKWLHTKLFVGKIYMYS